MHCSIRTTDNSRIWRLLLVLCAVFALSCILSQGQARAAYTTLQEGKAKSLNYAEHVCSVHGRCSYYDAKACLHHDKGVSCRAWNYLRNRQGRRFECGRLVWWREHRWGWQRDFLGQWKCYWGWRKQKGPATALERGRLEGITSRSG